MPCLSSPRLKLFAVKLSHSYRVYIGDGSATFCCGLQCWTAPIVVAYSSSTNENWHLTFSPLSYPSTAAPFSTSQGFLKSYRESLGGEKYDVVANGGWLKLEKEAFATDPQGALVSIIVDSLNESGGKVEGLKSDKLDLVLDLLAAKGKGFSADLVDGEWCTVLNKSAKGSPTIQKAVATKEKAGQSLANFDVKQSKFFGNVMFWKGRGELRSTVKYDPVGTGFDKVANRIVLRRIMCDIVGANLKIWKLPRIPLPLRRKGGYLDFVYLDDNMRVTKGNRGGTFVHFRPEFLEKALN